MNDFSEIKFDFLDKYCQSHKFSKELLITKHKENSNLYNLVFSNEKPCRLYNSLVIELINKNGIENLKIETSAIINRCTCDYKNSNDAASDYIDSLDNLNIVKDIHVSDENIILNNDFSDDTNIIEESIELDDVDKELLNFGDTKELDINDEELLDIEENSNIIKDDNEVLENLEYSDTDKDDNNLIDDTILITDLEKDDTKKPSLSFLDKLKKLFFNKKSKDEDDDNKDNIIESSEVIKDDEEIIIDNLDNESSMEDLSDMNLDDDEKLNGFDLENIIDDNNFSDNPENDESLNEELDSLKLDSDEKKYLDASLIEFTKSEDNSQNKKVNFWSKIKKYFVKNKNTEEDSNQIIDNDDDQSELINDDIKSSLENYTEENSDNISDDVTDNNSDDVKDNNSENSTDNK